MKSKWILSLLVILLTGILLAAPVLADSASGQAVYPTPTALPDGRIIYKVKENDTCISISLIYNVPLDDLRRLNGLQGTDCMLRLGQDLLLGIVEATPGPAVASPTPTSLVPGGTPFVGKGEICINLFDDVNGDAIAEDTETSLPGGAVSINDRLGKVSLTGQTTDTLNALCYKDIPSGEYTISLAVPDGYNATSSLQYTLNLQPGDTTVLDFGAQMNSAAQPTPVSEGGRSPLLGIVGIALVLAGGGLGIYFRMIRR